MADFEKALAKTLAHEGGYSFDPDDPGGETLRGITRRDYPDWIGWTIVDDGKRLGGVKTPEAIERHLAENVARFYRSEFWGPLRLDEFNSQAAAEEVFDTAVNCGKKTAAGFLQRALNALNDRGRLWADTREDGVIGSGTVSAANACTDRGRVQELVKLLNCLQGERYLRLCEKSERFEKYLKGWLARVAL